MYVNRKISRTALPIFTKFDICQFHYYLLTIYNLMYTHERKYKSVEMGVNITVFNGSDYNSVQWE
jgi:hypothetical protein